MKVQLDIINRCLPIFAGGMLMTSCSVGGLSRAEAERLLEEQLGGTEYFHVVPRANEEIVEMVFGPYNVIRRRGDMSGLWYDLEYDVVEQNEWESYFEVSEHSHDLPFGRRGTSTSVMAYIYKYRVDEVTGVREDSSGQCGYVVEFTYEQYDKAPWADRYIERFDKDRVWSACFRQYDDGWRATLMAS